jgi:uncharacterized membrane protein (GlpM family)
MNFSMIEEHKKTHKQTSASVFTGLIINYPLNLILLWFFIDYMSIQSTFIAGTMVTFFMTIVAYIRVYTIIRWFEQREPLR